MNIDRLLKKQQLNVQEQNAVSAYELAPTAKKWRIDGVPSALNCFGKSQGIDWSETIVLELEVDFPGMPSLFGLLLTALDRFMKFELNTDSRHEHVLNVETWEDVTDKQDLSTSNRGRGQGFGAIAIQVRNALNAE
ncbi:hypothetical protein ACYZT2_17505 [Pseudomonas sp. MDT1-85]